MSFWLILLTGATFFLLPGYSSPLLAEAASRYGQKSICESFRQIRSVFFFLLLFWLPKLYGHLQWTFSCENRVCFFFFLPKVDMFFSLLRKISCYKFKKPLRYCFCRKTHLPQTCDTTCSQSIEECSPYFLGLQR